MNDERLLDNQLLVGEVHQANTVGPLAERKRALLRNRLETVSGQEASYHVGLRCCRQHSVDEDLSKLRVWKARKPWVRCNLAPELFRQSLRSVQIDQPGTRSEEVRP